MRGQTEVKPIETEYNGYKFRSRLEARWAVFFDEAGISYEYELEGYEIGDGIKYLPDFYLPEYQLFIEIKPLANKSPDFPKKRQEWEDKCRKFRTTTNKAIMIVFGDPAEDVWGTLFAWSFTNNGGGEFEESARFVPLGEYSKPDVCIMVFGEKGETVCIKPDMTVNDRVIDAHMMIENRWEEALHLLNAPMTMLFNPELSTGFDAMRKKARQARFEYGENPRNNDNVTMDDLVKLDQKNMKLMMAFCAVKGIKIPFESNEISDWLKLCQEMQTECRTSGQMEAAGYEAVYEYCHGVVMQIMKEKALAETFGPD